eukprot:SAG31_NODE_3413_length_4303_cov_1.471694_5_plen_585_part_00
MPLLATAEMVSAADLLGSIRSKQKSCIDVVSAAFARIEDTKELLCCVDVLKDAGMAQAKAVDERIAAGEVLRILEGLPIVVKSNIHGPPGTLCAAGTLALADHRPTTVAPIVQLLLDEGAIVVAKVHMLELAIGTNAESPLYGRCLNPYNQVSLRSLASLSHLLSLLHFHQAYNCGGSSSGTAVAVCAVIAPCGLGTDTAGSCRIPAALCGVVGMRPSTRRLSCEGIVPVSAMMDTPGPMGSCVADLCLLDSVLTKTDMVIKRDLKGLKIAVPMDHISSKAPLSETVQKSFAVARAAFQACGATVEEIDGFKSVMETTKDLWTAPIVPMLFDDSHTHLTKYLDYCGDERPVATVEDILAKVENGGRKQMLSKHTVTEGESKREMRIEEVEDKIKIRDESRARAESAYRAFFADNGISVLIIPSFPNEITKVDGSVEKEALAEFMNEYTFSMHLNEISVPSLVLPIKSVVHPDSGVPCSLLVYGTDDRDLLAVALGLEEALKGDPKLEQLKDSHPEEWKIFCALDVDGSGGLDKDELWVKLSALGEEQATQLVEMVDRNADGVIDFHEFVSAFANVQLFAEVMGT